MALELSVSEIHKDISYGSIVGLRVYLTRHYKYPYLISVTKKYDDRKIKLQKLMDNSLTVKEIHEKINVGSLNSLQYYLYKNYQYPRLKKKTMKPSECRKGLDELIGGHKDELEKLMDLRLSAREIFDKINCDIPFYRLQDYLKKHYQYPNNFPDKYYRYNKVLDDFMSLGLSVSEIHRRINYGSLVGLRLYLNNNYKYPGSIVFRFENHKEELEKLMALRLPVVEIYEKINYGSLLGLKKHLRDNYLYSCPKKRKGIFQVNKQELEKLMDLGLTVLEIHKRINYGSSMGLRAYLKKNYQYPVLKKYPKIKYDRKFSKIKKELEELMSLGLSVMEIHEGINYGSYAGLRSYLKKNYQYSTQIRFSDYKQKLEEFMLKGMSAKEMNEQIGVGSIACLKYYLKEKYQYVKYETKITLLNERKTELEKLMADGLSTREIHERINCGTESGLYKYLKRHYNYPARAVTKLDERKLELEEFMSDGLSLREIHERINYGSYVGLYLYLKRNYGYPEVAGSKFTRHKAKLEELMSIGLNVREIHERINYGSESGLSYYLKKNYQYPYKNSPSGAI